MLRWLLAREDKTKTKTKNKMKKGWKEVQTEETREGENQVGRHREVKRWSNNEGYKPSGMPPYVLLDTSHKDHILDESKKNQNTTQKYAHLF